MSIHRWPQILKRIPKAAPLLGLDVGSKTIGVAISDPGWKVATPLLTLERSNLSKDLEQLARLATERGVRGFVIGMPYNMDDSQGQSAQRSKTFAAQMIEAKALFGAEPEIAFFDERLSTAAMEDFLIESGVRREKRNEVIDKLAAQTILQSALDKQTDTGTPA